MEYPHATVTLRACSFEAEGIPSRRLKICGTKGTIDLCPVERFDGKPLQMRLSLLEGNAEHAVGTHTVEFDIKRDRYADQLLELAKTVNGEMENPYGYAHDYLVQELLLACAGYRGWDA
jgi:predicted dehydrogenase